MQKKLPVGLFDLKVEIDKLSWLLNHPDEDSESWWFLCNEVAVKLEDLVPDLTWRPFEEVFGLDNKCPHCYNKT